jgi:hypothetical protein
MAEVLGPPGDERIRGAIESDGYYLFNVSPEAS